MLKSLTADLPIQSSLNPQRLNRRPETKMPPLFLVGRIVKLQILAVRGMGSAKRSQQPDAGHEAWALRGFLVSEFLIGNLAVNFGEP